MTFVKLPTTNLLNQYIGLITLRVIKVLSQICLTFHLFVVFTIKLLSNFTFASFNVINLLKVKPFNIFKSGLSKNSFKRLDTYLINKIDSSIVNSKNGYLDFG